MDNLGYYNRFREVPPTAQKEIQGGRMKGMTDINPMWRIKCLTEAFGACGIGWYYKVTNKWMQVQGEETASFVDIELFIKVDGEWSMPIHGTGGSMFASKEKSGIYVSDECYKMATTDAISVACKQLGIGADIYWMKDKSKYDKKPEDNTITIKEAKILREIVEKKGLTIETVFPKCPPEQFTKEQYVAALKQLEKLKDKVI